MSEEEEITDEKESTMETVDDKFGYNDKSPVCPHYERDTCLILFKCCNEWYPCHKCHNEAMASLADQNGMEPENSRPSHDNETVSMEVDDAEVASSSEAFEIRSGAEEVAAQQEDASTTGDEVDVNVVDETSDEQSNRTSGACNHDLNGVKAGTGSSHEMDSTHFCPSGIKEEHSVSTAVDGIQAFGQLQENSERSIGIHFSRGSKFPMEEQESDRPYLQDHLEDDDSMLEERDDLEMTSSTEIIEMGNDSRGQQEDASTAGDEVDVNVVDVTSDELSNRQTGACSDENGVKAGSESYKLQVAMDVTPSSPSGMEEKQSVATALDGIEAFGQQQEKSERSSGSHFSGECKFPMEEQESNRPYPQDHLEDDDSMSAERDDLEMTSSSEIIEMRNDSRDPQDDAQSIGEVEDTNDVTSGPWDEPSNEESEEDNEENGVEVGSEENDPQAPTNVLPPSAEGNGKTHSMATSRDGARLICARCKKEQEFSKECNKCHRPFAKYCCETCKLLIENDVDPYHCPDCGICRANKKDHFHCKVCKVCMSRSIKDSHICSDNRGHDPCAICLEEVFTGASTFPCLHIVHKECAIKLVRSGSLVCPMCRTGIFQNGKVKTTAVETTPEIPSYQSLWEIVKKGFCYPFITLYNGKLPRPFGRNVNAVSIV